MNSHCPGRRQSADRLPRRQRPGKAAWSRRPSDRLPPPAAGNHPPRPGPCRQSGDWKVRPRRRSRSCKWLSSAGPCRRSSRCFPANLSPRRSRRARASCRKCAVSAAHSWRSSPRVRSGGSPCGLGDRLCGYRPIGPPARRSRHQSGHPRPCRRQKGSAWPCIVSFWDSFFGESPRSCDGPALDQGLGNDPAQSGMGVDDRGRHREHRAGIFSQTFQSNDGLGTATVTT